MVSVHHEQSAQYESMVSVRVENVTNNVTNDIIVRTTHSSYGVIFFILCQISVRGVL
jgi:hypothetical protein